MTSGGGVVVVLQARMGSTRLPGKVLADIDGRSILAHCIARLTSAAVGPLVVATTVEKEDAAVEAEALRWGARVFRGPRDDVLQRFLLVADSLNARVLVRATADNPAVDADAPERVLSALAVHRADHVVEAGLPVGGAVEAVTVSALREAAQASADPYDREHVTPWVRTHPGRCRALVPPAPAHLLRPDLRLTVDTPVDLAFVGRVLAAVGAGARVVPLSEIIGAADRESGTGGL